MEKKRLATRLVASGIVVCMTLLIYKVIRGRELIISGSDISILVGALLGNYLGYKIRRD